MGVLSALEISKKQYYIFKSNKLRENIGASEIIRYVTEELAVDKCQKHGGEIINSGGGQTIFYFVEDSSSRSFAEELSLELLNDYPSLEFFISSIDYNPEKDHIMGKIRDLHKKLAKKKAMRMQYAFITDFGVTQECDSTRLPAVFSDYDEEEGFIYLSRESKSKIDMFGDMLKDKEQRKFALNYADLGISKNQKSYIAITHIDGNRMGKRLKKLREKYEKSYTPENTKERNESYIRELREFSEQTKEAFEQAFNKVTEILRSKLDYLKENDLNIKDDVLPIRKVILSGDDVCYITDARIAIECAYIFLRELEKHEAMGEKITACAGIAMVREKYPFFKAYELAEELCRSAKSGIADDANESRIDWHIVQGEYSNNLGEIRSSAYKTLDGKDLLLRPLIVSEGIDAINSYHNFKKDMSLINTKSKIIPRNKVKSMLMEMKKGEEHLDTYIEINNLYTLFGMHRMGAKTGFVNNKCVLFDAVETMDYFIPLIDEEE